MKASFVAALAAWAVCGLLFGGSAEAGQPRLRIEGFEKNRTAVSYLSWDTEGGPRAETNLLRPKEALGVAVLLEGRWQSCREMAATSEAVAGNGRRYSIAVAPDIRLHWSLVPGKDRLTMAFSAAGAGLEKIEAVDLVLPFDPSVTPTTIIPSIRHSDGSMRLPAVVNAPDFGQMLLTDDQPEHLTARLEGDRQRKTVDLRLRLAKPMSGKAYTLTLAPLRLAAPKGLHDTLLWTSARRGWFGAFGPSARWGAPDHGRRFGAPAGTLANNVISDPASCSLWFYADQALWTPQLAPGVSAMDMVRDTLDWWLAERMLPSGEMICYWDKTGFLDANAGPLIAAWDYVEATGDTAWLAAHIEPIEKLAEFLARRDVDGDGLVEAKQSGNRGTLVEPHRSSCWWDAVNYGHKCGYSNAVIYRAWRCLADLERKLGRTAQHGRYAGLADRLKAAYAKTLLNPKTGWLAGWKSKDGELHDYAFTAVNGMAIEYGLVSPEEGRKILRRMWKKIDEAGFTRFDLGVPSSLVPVRRSDYLLPDAIGCPKREDGADTLGQYMNGGITAGQVLHFLAAHYVVGETEKADMVLRAMLRRQQQGGFQNGVADAALRGIDWTDWNGNPTGYEGYLADSFRFLQAVLLREAAFRDRLYRPLRE